MALDHSSMLEPSPRRLMDTEEKHARRNFTGDDLATTLAVRNGFSIARSDGSFQSICGSCGATATSPMWGKDCYECRRRAADPFYGDQKREKQRQMGLE